ncbi:MAG TPA: sulfite oxidase-like oxidoreductase [Chloroflexota bacterium]|nr:sulfite oxidase-like oxidoreductase [Chloroflexota bacterium]
MAFDFFHRDSKKRSSLTDPERVPPGQVVTEKWPVLHYGGIPRVDLKKWDFRVFGQVENPLTLTWEQFQALPRAEVHCDIHCVTRWSRLDNTFAGVPFREVYERAAPRSGARFVMIHAENGFTTNVPLDDLLQPNVLLADTHDGKPLPPEHGWPLRLVVPHLYFWKSAKWLRGFEFLPADRPGFWEQYGYHMRGDPWKEERYS